MKWSLFEKSTSTKFTLREETLDEIVVHVQNFAKEKKLDDSRVNRYGFLIDDALYHWLSAMGAGKELTVSCGTRLATPYVSISMAGNKCNPYEKNTTDFGSAETDFTINFGQLPEYIYQDGDNILRLELKREPNMMRQIGIVAIAAVIVGLLGNTVLPPAIKELLLQSVFGPITDMFFSLLRCIAGPMVFLSVVWGICGMGDSRLFGRIGKKVLLSYTSMTTIGAIIGALFFPIFLSFSGGTSVSGQFSSLLQMILSIVPSSIVDPFSTGNTLQIIFLAVAMGIALITISNKVTPLIHAVDQLNLVIQKCMGVIGKLVPFIVFLLVTNMIWSHTLELFSTMWQFFAVMILSFLLVILIISLLVSAEQKVSFIKLLKKNWSTFLIAFSTASSAAAFEANMSTAKEKFGINKDLAGFAIPLGMIVHNPIAACYNSIIIIYFASVYGLSCSLGWLIVGIFVCTVVAISSPPIPGGASVSYALLFSQMGIPEEALAVVLILDVLTDFFVTAFECYVLPISIVNIADKLQMLDKEILKK